MWQELACFRTDGSVYPVTAGWTSPAGFLAGRNRDFRIVAIGGALIILENTKRLPAGRFSMPKALCLVGIRRGRSVAAGVRTRSGGRVPLHRLSLTMDVGCLVCSVDLGYMSWTTLREQKYPHGDGILDRCTRLGRLQYLYSIRRTSTGRQKMVREPLPPAKRKRLEKVFEVASKKATPPPPPPISTMSRNCCGQCVRASRATPPTSARIIENLQKKYNNNRKGSPLAQFKERGARGA